MGAFLTCVALVLTLVLLAWPLPTGQVVEEVVTFPSWCSDGCLTLTHWDRHVSDPRLGEAVAIAYHFNPQFRHLAQGAAMRGTSISFGPANGGAYYRLTEGTVVVDSSLADESEAVLATLLTHELTHAATVSRLSALLGGTSGCFEAEAFAVSWQESTWAAVRASDSGDTSGWAREFDRLLAQWNTHQLSTYTLQVRGWQKECFGRDLVEY